jgi:hypothetical protein
MGRSLLLYIVGTWEEEYSLCGEIFAKEFFLRTGIYLNAHQLLSLHQINPTGKILAKFHQFPQH